MEGNTIHDFTITKRALSKENSFKCMIKGTNLTSLYTLLDVLSLALVAPIFFLFNLEVIMEGHLMAYYLSCPEPKMVQSMRNTSQGYL